MTAVTIQLLPEIAQVLRERAARDGQTLDAYLALLAVRTAHTLAPTAPAPPQDEDDDTRPWRGVFAPEIPLETAFTRDLSLRSEDLDKQVATCNMSWHRTVHDDE